MILVTSFALYHSWVSSQRGPPRGISSCSKTIRVTDCGEQRLLTSMLIVNHLNSCNVSIIGHRGSMRRCGSVNLFVSYF